MPSLFLSVKETKSAVGKDMNNERFTKHILKSLRFKLRAI
jgi:hypothetical protein